jgi:hypothetical protein
MAATVWASPTREAGIGSHLMAAAACGAAWLRGGRTCRLPLSIGLLELFLLLDAAFNWRWIVHGLLVNAAMEQHLYGERKAPQELILGVLFAVTMATIVVTLRHLRGRSGACLSICGALISAAFWMIEVISLHATDAILQHALGPIMLVALVWIVSSSMIVVGILWDLKREA